MTDADKKLLEDTRQEHSWSSDDWRTMAEELADRLEEVLAERKFLFENVATCRKCPNHKNKGKTCQSMLGVDCIEYIHRFVKEQEKQL